MKYIPLSGKRAAGRLAIVDDADYGKLNKYSWSVMGKGYVRAGTSKNVNGKHVTISFNMSRVIMDPPKGMQVDHINGDKLDNRKCNLRVCTNAENCRNRSRYKGSTNVSGYKGVYWHKVNRKWVVMIKVNQKIHYLGSFRNKQTAANIYNAAASKYFGNFAVLNKEVL